ncbi:MAG: hypothetical protein R2912_05110 [Eubacteriales bacterium]
MFLALTKEYIMAQYGLADVHEVVGYMIRTLKFFMASDSGETDENAGNALNR